MSCGCGGMPLSHMLRLEAARTAAAYSTPTQHVDNSQRLYDFLRGSKTDAELDTAKPKPDQASSRARNEFIGVNGLASLNLPESIIGKLVQHGVASVGTLVQWSFHQLRDHADMGTPEIDTLREALTPHGLRLGMDADQIRNWIIHGSLKDPAVAAQARA